MNPPEESNPVNGSISASEVRRIAHDLNNRLMAIKGYLHFAIQDLAEDHPAGPDLRAAVEATDLTRELTLELLNLARAADIGGQ